MVAAILSVALGTGRQSDAASILLPGQNEFPGVRGKYLMGAQVALADGAEAGWYNTAGYARGAEAAINTGVGLVEYIELSADGTRTGSVTSGAGFFSYAAGPRQGERPPRFGWGLYISWPSNNAISGAYTSEDSIPASSLPDAMTLGADFDTDFPGGVSSFTEARGRAALRILSTGFGMGLAVASWFRIGVGIDFQRVQLEKSSDIQIGYAGINGSATSLSGHESAAETISGTSDRLVAHTGIQIDIGPRVVLGLRVRFVPVPLGGVGSIHRTRSRQLAVDRAGQTAFDSSEFVTVQATELEFELRSPRAIDVGAAFIFDTFAFEFDVTFDSAITRYEVLPPVESSVPSTATESFPAVETSRVSVIRYAVGIAMSGMGRSSFLFGLSLDESGVPGDDDLFTHLDTSTLSMGFHWPIRVGAVSAGFRYRAGVTSRTQLPAVSGVESSRVRLAFQSLEIGMAAELVF